jgi:hypothetical protein
MQDKIVRKKTTTKNAPALFVAYTSAGNAKKKFLPSIN